MTSRPVLRASLLVAGALVSVSSLAAAQGTPDTPVPGRTVERTVLEGALVSQTPTVLSELVDETVRRDARSRQRILNEFVTDANGRRLLVATIDEQRVDQPSGGHHVTRAFVSFDADGRASITRREREEVVNKGDGLFVTEIEVTTPSINGSAFVATERIDQRERRAGDQVVSQETTRSVDPTASGRWDVVEQSILTRNVANRTGEQLIYRRDSSGTLVASERIVSREWTAGMQEFRLDEMYARDVNNAGALATRPTRLVETVRSARSGDESETTRTVHEREGDRLQVVERVIERSRADARGGVVIDSELQQPVVHEQLQTVARSRMRKSQ